MRACALPAAYFCRPYRSPFLRPEGENEGRLGVWLFEFDLFRLVKSTGANFRAKIMPFILIYTQDQCDLDSPLLYSSKVLAVKGPISFPELRSPWPVVGKRELWEHPFQACAIDTIDVDCALHNETGHAELGYLLCYLKMDTPRALVFRSLVKGNEALGTRLLWHITHIL